MPEPEDTAVAEALEPAPGTDLEPVEVEAERPQGVEALISSALDPVIARLRQPPAPEAVKFKIQTNPKDGALGKRALIVAYVDSRFCSDRLNIVAPGMWDEEPLELRHRNAGKEIAAVLYAVTLKLPLANGQEHCVTHMDVGTSSSIETEMGMKALYSDAFKRACVKFGIGAVLYAAPKIYIKGGDLDHYGPDGKGHKFALSEANLKFCRREYSKFLASVEDIYGKPLSHGDAAEGQGDLDVEDYGGGQDRGREPDGPPFGPEADDTLKTKLMGALMFLLDGELDLAGEVHGKLIERCGGYMPAPVAACLGITAGAVKTHAEEAAAMAAHEELDAEAAAAAGAEDEVPAEAPAAAEPDTGGSQA